MTRFYSHLKGKDTLPDNDNHYEPMGIKESNHPVRQANAAGIGVVVLSTWPYERP